MAERPIIVANRLGRGFLEGRSDEERKQHGQFFTPPEVAEFMGQLVAEHLTGETVRLLDPGAGSGILSSGVIEALAASPTPPAQVEVVAYESDLPLAEVLTESLDGVRAWASERGIDVRFVVEREDFVLRNAPALRSAHATGRTGDFDATVLNPPYFKVAKDDARAKAAAALVHGQPNIYAFFMGIAATMLRKEGVLVSITPRSFASGPYFRLFRERFFSWARPSHVHLFDSRTDTFQRDSVLQENVILRASRVDGWLRSSPHGSVRVSTSGGVSDLAERRTRVLPLTTVVDTRHGDYVLRIPTDEQQERVVALVDSWTDRLASHGLRISTGPVVPFRTGSISDQCGTPSHAPLLWMQNVRSMRVEWPARTRKGQSIRVEKESEPLLVPNRTYVLMRRFSAKEEHRRLVVAPLLANVLPGAFVGLENHLNYIHRVGGTFLPEEATGLAALLSSSVMDTYFRVSNGNTQVSATELRTMPLPPPALLAALGKRVLTEGGGVDAAERVVAEMLAAVDAETQKEAAHA